MVNIRRYDSPQVASDPNRQAPQQLTQSPTAKVIGLAGQAAQIAYGEYERNQALAADDATAKLSLELKTQEEKVKQLQGMNALRKLGEGGSFKMRDPGPAPEMVSEPGKMPDKVETPTVEGFRRPSSQYQKDTTAPPTDPNAVAAKAAAAAMSPAEQAQAKADQAKTRDAIETAATINAMKDLESGNSPYVDHYKAINDKVQELSKSLSGAAKERFLKDAFLRKEAFTLGVVSHQNAQQRVVAFSTAEAKVGGFLEIIHNAPNTAAARQAMADLADYTRDFQMKWNGLSGEALDNKVKSVVSTAKVGEIQAMMAVDKQGALRLMKEAQDGGMLTPAHETAISKAVTEAANKAFAQSAVDALPFGQEGFDIFEAQKAFNKTTDDQDKKEEFKRLSESAYHTFNVAKDKKAETLAEGVLKFAQSVNDNPFAVRDSPLMAAYRRERPIEGQKLWEHFDQRGKELINKAKEHKQERFAENVLPYLLDEDLRAGLTNEKLLQLSPMIGPANTVMLAKELGAADSADYFKVPPRVANAMVSRSGYNLKDKKVAEMVNQAVVSASVELAQLRKGQNGKPGKAITPEDIETVLATNLASYGTATTFWTGAPDKKVPLGSMTEEQFTEAVKVLDSDTNSSGVGAEYDTFKIVIQDKGLDRFPTPEQELKAFTAWRIEMNKKGSKEPRPTPDQIKRAKKRDPLLLRKW